MSERKYQEVAHKLRIKFGLQKDPSDHEVIIWSLRVYLLKLQGTNYVEAGRVAAKETFQDYQTIKYASQADTIEALLEEISRKEKEK